MKINQDHNFLFFIGTGRTGSTLIGQLINHHPSCLISNESRYLDNVIIGKISDDTAYRRMVRQAYEQFIYGLRNSSHHKDTISRYQTRWRSIQKKNAPIFNKSNINLVGDKKAGGTTHIFRSQPEEFL